MKKLFLIFLLLIYFSPLTLHCQSNNDEKAIDFSTQHLQPIFKILRTQSDTISPSCIETLKKIHFLKNQLVNNQTLTNNDQDVNRSILRSLYNNALEFCKVDAQNICNHKTSLAIRNECKKLTN